MSNENGEKSDIRAHWERYGPTNERLKGVVEPVAERFADEVEVLLQETNSEERQELLEDTANIYTLPYGRVGMLPPVLFDQICRGDMEPDQQLTVPHDDEEIETIANTYSQWCWLQAHSEIYNISYFPSPEKVAEKMKELKGMRYPDEEWQMAAQAMRHALRDEPNFTMDAHRYNRMLNAGLDYDQLEPMDRMEHKPYESYVLALSRISAEDRTWSSTRDAIQLPVGEYGERAAAKLTRSTLLLNDFIKSSPAITRSIEEQIDADDSIKDLLRKHTARSRERFEVSMDDFALHGAKATLTEGVTTVAQTLSLLTAEKVEGYENYDDLIRDILDSNIVEQLTRILEVGYIGPRTLSGVYRPNILEVGVNGKPMLSRRTIRRLSEIRKEDSKREVYGWQKYESGETEECPMVLGLPCPAAAPDGAISSIRDAFKRFYVN